MLTTTHLAAIYLFDPTLGNLTNTLKIAGGNLFIVILVVTGIILLLKRHMMLMVEMFALAIVVGIFIYVPGFFQGAAQAVAGIL